MGSNIQSAFVRKRRGRLREESLSIAADRVNSRAVSIISAVLVIELLI